MDFFTFIVWRDGQLDKWVARVAIGDERVGWRAISKWITDGEWQVITVVAETHRLNALGVDQWVDRYRLFLQRPTLTSAPVIREEIPREISPPIALQPLESTPVRS